MEAVIKLVGSEATKVKNDGFNGAVTRIGDGKVVESKNHLLVEMIKLSARMCVKSKEVKVRSMNLDL